MNFLLFCFTPTFSWHRKTLGFKPILIHHLEKGEAEVLWEHLKVCFFQLYLNLTAAGIFLIDKPEKKDIQGKFGIDIFEKIIKDHESIEYWVCLY